MPWMNPFVKRLGKAAAAAAIERWVPDGMRVYCVGDIHGRDDLLRQMAERVEADIEAPSFEYAVTVFVGGGSVPTRAQYRLRGPAEVRRFLERLDGEIA